MRGRHDREKEREREREDGKSDHARKIKPSLFWCEIMHSSRKQDKKLHIRPVPHEGIMSAFTRVSNFAIYLCRWDVPCFDIPMDNIIMRAATVN